VNKYVEKAPLDSLKARPDAAYNKLPLPQADSASLKIKDLAQPAGHLVRKLRRLEKTSFVYNRLRQRPPRNAWKCFFYIDFSRLMATKRLLAGPPVARVQQHPFDHAQVDIARPEVLEGRHRVTGMLHGDTAFDDVALAQVHPRIDWGGNREIAGGLESGLIHRDSSARSL
jgi:hypothetical protein